MRSIECYVADDLSTLNHLNFYVVSRGSAVHSAALL